MIAYFDFKGVPAKVEYKKLPVKIVNGKEVVVYELEKFFRESSKISKQEFDKMVKESWYW